MKIFANICLLLLLAGCSLTDVSTPVSPPVVPSQVAVLATVTKAVGHAGPTQQGRADPTATASLVRVVCNCQSLNIRSKAGDDIAAVGWLDVGAAVRVTGKRFGVWVEISSGGWVHGAYLCPVP